MRSLTSSFAIYAIPLHILLAIGCGPRAVTFKEDAAKADNTIEVQDRNVHEQRGYIGSAKCAECHQEIAESYAGHSMSRSATPIDGRFDLHANAEFDAGRFRYAARMQDGKCVHHQGRLTDDGSEMATVELVSSHAIGSGNHGQSFLVQRGDQIYMSPMTWYPDKQKWDLSPGYEKNNSQFNRPVIAECLYCHTDLATPVADTLNTYEVPPIHSHGIGCERCHGPGAEHAAMHEGNVAAGSTDPIVNPSSVDFANREAICQQCHLSGTLRVLKPGKSLYDFKPGQPLSSTYTVFTQGSVGEEKFVGHVEQMYASRCFAESNGKLGCISCHDPHSLPTEEDRVAFYRDRCLACHNEAPCSVPLDVRHETTAEDSCIVCHMPNIDTEVRHAASTDHSIPRQLQTGRNEQTSQQLVAFPDNEVAKPTKRDRAIALARLSNREKQDLDRATLQQATQWLRDAVRERPDDHEASEALVGMLLAKNDIDGALQVCRQVLARRPLREQTLSIAADIYAGTRNFGQAIPCLKQAIRVNPWMANYWFKLGQAYAATGQWYLCRQTAQEAKKKFPNSVGVRHLLVQSNLALRDADVAEAEFRELEDYRPVGLRSLRKAYEQQKQALEQSSR